MKPIVHTGRRFRHKTTGVVHTVIEATEKRVITWGDQSSKPTEGGETWLGHPYQFQKEFELVK